MEKALIVIAQGLGKGIYEGLVKNPQYISNAIFYIFVGFIVWTILNLIYKLIVYHKNKNKPDVGYVVHKHAMDIIEKNISKK